MVNYTRHDCKFKFDNCDQHFFVNAEKRIVVCKLIGCLTGPERDRWNYPSFNCAILTATGKAVCSSNDTFDVNVGKKIALAKAENAIYTKACHIIDEEIIKCNTYVEMLEPFFDKANKVIMHNLDYIEKITD